MTVEKRNILNKLVAEMRIRAEKIGSMHTWWQDIIDAETFLKLDDNIASEKKADEWIAEFKRGHEKYKYHK